jgi:hypothetical protein
MKPAVPWLFAVANALIAGLVAFGVFAGLPDRWLWVDVPAILVILLLLGASVALVRQGSWSFNVVRIAAGLVLVFGLVVIAGLTSAAAFLSGVLGETGRAGFIVFVTVIALVLPYLVIYPGLQLLWAFGALRSDSKS